MKMKLTMQIVLMLTSLDFYKEFTLLYSNGFNVDTKFYSSVKIV